MAGGDGRLALITCDEAANLCTAMPSSNGHVLPSPSRSVARSGPSCARSASSALEPRSARPESTTI
jgi:hypothetical protein